MASILTEEKYPCSLRITDPHLSSSSTRESHRLDSHFFGTQLDKAVTEDTHPKDHKHPQRHREQHLGAKRHEHAFLCFGGCKKTFIRKESRERHWKRYRSCEERHATFVSGTEHEPDYEAVLRRRLKRQERITKQ